MQRTTLTAEQRSDLDAAMRKRHESAALSRCVLLWADGERRVDIRSKLACNDDFVMRWTTGYEIQGLAGLVSLHPGRAPKVPTTVKMEARTFDRMLKHLPRDGSTHWSSRKPAVELGDVSFSAMQRVWRKRGVRLHRLDTHMVSNDPDFEAAAADVIGSYLDPPALAAVFCVDEKAAIQALNRKDRMLLLSPGRAESHGFEDKRNGMLSLFAALNTSTGEVFGKTAARHTSEQFVAFLAAVAASQLRRQIHVICDAVSSHKTPLVPAFSAKHRRVRMYYTPTYLSWPKQVENWFSRMQRDVINRGVFTNIKDLDKKLMNTSTGTTRVPSSPSP